MADELKSYPIPNLVQGVSQQTAQQRRDTQCEAQFDCINSPVNGCEARPHADLVAMALGAQADGGFFYEIFRGDSEHYLVVITKAGFAGADNRRLRVFDLNTGLPCYVNYIADDTYITTARDPQDSLVATTLEDLTFIASRETLPAMDQTDLSPARENAALVFFRAGGYSVRFVCTVHYGGSSYVFYYDTPDNSTSGNALYIATNQLARTFYNAFRGGVGGSVGTGVGDVGGTAGVGTGATSLTSLGFNVSINGSCIKIWRPDNNAFTVDATDGVGDTYLKVIKDQAKNFSDLPGGAFVGFTTKVIGSNKQTEDDYWVQFKGNDGVTGYWEEVIAPGTPLTFASATMPHALFNTGDGTFEWKQVNWGDRVSGDGINSALDPTFTGKPIYDMGYDNGRLVIMHEGGAVWSRARNPYVFFPDTAQTTLDTDPVDITVGGGKRIALLRRIVQINEATFLWAQKLQFRITSGQNPFKQDTVDSKLSTAYEFSPDAVPFGIGESLYFATEPGPYATIRDLTVVDGKPQGASDVTGHIKRYIKAGIRYITASDTLGILFAVSGGDPSKLYAYNYLLTDKERIQSAWNTWRLPGQSRIVWAGVSKNHLYMAVQRDEGLAILRVDMSVDLVDADEDSDYLTRMDFRTTEYDCGIAYEPGTQETVIQLPYSLPEAEGFEDPDGSLLATCPMFVVNRVDSANYVRGKAWHITSITGNTIRVSGDASGEGLYVGWRIEASRTESRFYLKNESGVVATERLTVKDLAVAYANTGYFRAEVEQPGQETLITEMTGRRFGDPGNVVGRHPLPEGFHKVPINAPSESFSVTLVNDSFLPSRWTSANYNYIAAFLAKPGAGQGKRG